MESFEKNNSGYDQTSVNQFDYSNTTQYQDPYGSSQNYGQYDYTPTGYGNGMNQGFEGGNAVKLSGLENIGAIISNEVVAKSYLFMVVALLITAFSALTTDKFVIYDLVVSGTYWLFFIGELAIVWGASLAIRKNKPIIAGVLFAAYSYMTGMICSILFFLYTSESLVSTFFICAAMFGGMAIFGMVTDKDLSSVGNICLMGLWGIIIASLVNFVFLKSSTFDFIVDIIGIVIFVGLTAYDANKTKRIAETSDSSNALSMSMYCALELYLDFINLFLRLISIFGKKK